MSAPQTPLAAETASAAPTRPYEPRSWWEGRGGLVLPLVVAAFSTYLLVGVLVMEVPEGTDFPGPRFYPVLLVVAGYLVSVLMTVAIQRSPELPEDGSAPKRSDWAAVAWSAGGFLAFALGLPFLGWILAAALLFWCVARGFGSTRPLFDLTVALTVSSAVYLAFDVLLGLNLPSGLLGGGF